MAGDGQPSCASSSVPVSALQQFLAALRAKDFDGAKALAFQILTDEPRNESVLRSLPVIEHCLRLAQQPASAELESEDEESSSEDGGDDGDDDDDDDDDGDDDGDDDDGPTMTAAKTMKTAAIAAATVATASRRRTAACDSRR